MLSRTLKMVGRIERKLYYFLSSFALSYILEAGMVNNNTNECEIIGGKEG